MTSAVKKLLDDFDHLTSAEQQQALYEVLKRTKEMHTEPLTDDDFAEIADQLFVMLDAEEEHCQSAAR